VKKVNGRFLLSQGKMRECCTTIQLYDWVSNNGNLNANGWSVPLNYVKMVVLASAYENTEC